jgi:uncharacterized protein
VLLLVAAKERQVRLEVGYGLEGTLPDATAARIIREAIAPRFQAGDYYGGLRDAVEAIIAATRGEFKAPAGDYSPADGSRKPGVQDAVGLFIGLVILVLLLSTRTGRWFLFYMLMSGAFGGGRGRSGGFGGGGFRGGGGRFGGGGAGGSW